VHKKTHRGCRAGQNVRRARLIKQNDSPQSESCAVINNVNNVNRSNGRHSSVNRNIIIGSWNARSINNKTDDIDELFQNKRLDILTLSETWHEDSRATCLKLLKAKGYKIVEKAREVPLGQDINPNFINHGGVAIVVKQNFTLHPIVTHKFKTFEQVGTKIKYNNSELIVFSIYRPGSDTIINTFFDEFSNLLQNLSSYSCPLLLTGDINKRLDKKTGQQHHKVFETSERF
jgi:exonuclease III